MQAQKTQIHQHGGGNGLDNCNDRGLTADGPKLLETEFIADGEGNKAQRNIGNGL